MKTRNRQMRHFLWIFCLAAFLAVGSAEGAVVFERTTPYHHIRVVDQGGFRVLSFDGSIETRMSLRNPDLGHFVYTEFFHMPFLWNSEIRNVLMIGLGGGSAQRAFQRYHPNVTVDTVELDPVVREVAGRFFSFQEGPTQRAHIDDGRTFLRRTEQRWDLLVVDAYVRSRYGSFIPYHLATREFFELARERLAPNGVVAYNVIGTIGGDRSEIVAALYRTMNTVFPQVYMFPSTESQNVVLIGTRQPERLTAEQLAQRVNALVASGQMSVPFFALRFLSLWLAPPPRLARAPVLKDDFAPVDNLLRVRR